MVWREPTNHVTDCYFCSIDVTGINRKNRSSLKYPDLEITRRPVAHCDEIPVPVFGELPDISDEDSSSVPEDEEDEVVLNDDAPCPFSQKELNDLVCNLYCYWHPDWRKRTSSLTVLASPFTATVIKSSSVFSLKKSMNPKIGDCSLTAASDRWNVFCFTTATSLPLYPLITQLHWRRSMKRWSMCWRKFVMISMSGWRCWIFCWDTSPSTHAFGGCGIVGTLLRITQRRTGLCGRNWCLAEQGTSSTILW